MLGGPGGGEDTRRGNREDNLGSKDREGREGSIGHIQTTKSFQKEGGRRAPRRRFRTNAFVLPTAFFGAGRECRLGPRPDPRAYLVEPVSKKYTRFDLFVVGRRIPQSPLSPLFQHLAPTTHPHAYAGPIPSPSPRFAPRTVPPSRFPSPLQRARRPGNLGSVGPQATGGIARKPLESTVAVLAVQQRRRRTKRNKALARLIRRERIPGLPPSTSYCFAPEVSSSRSLSASSCLRLGRALRSRATHNSGTPI